MKEFRKNITSNGSHLKKKNCLLHTFLIPIVDKQTKLVGMDVRMLVKHPILLTGVSTKFNIFCKLSIQLNTSKDWLFCFPKKSLLSLNIVEYC